VLFWVVSLHHQINETMKKLLIKNYIQGLCSFLDEKGIKWIHAGKDEQIIIYYNSDEELFLLGFEFGKFYTLIEN